MKLQSEKKRVIFGAAALIALLIVVGVAWYMNSSKSESTGNTFLVETPTLVIETPQKVSISQTDELILDLEIERLGDALYPAASFSISFDSSRLEFLGVKEGNVFVQNSSTDTQITQKLPEWSYNVEQSNKSGLINIMYLDITGGKNAFCQELLAAEDNVVLRLAFRIRGSARVSDICDLIVEDAVFAASDETQSLSINQNTLQIKNGKIIVGE